ncbi:Pentatricopeptide repeat [Dillenia turbinata]|uniref:Pentatricopeptide repeat n=1 Tax=Dillenia turbinata TaxID=194707 RepID=A0AAN8UW58_9MAGN
MVSTACANFTSLQPNYTSINKVSRTHQFFQLKTSILQKPTIYNSQKLISQVGILDNAEIREDERVKFRWVEIGNEISEEKKETISQLPAKMTRRCKAVLKQIICFSSEKICLSDLLGAWVKIMKPRRADWLTVLKELKRIDNPLLLQVAELALLDEANVQDYTKIVRGYAKQNRVQDAESTLLEMKTSGFICDQVILTAMVDMYGKAGNLKLAEETFEHIMLLGQPLDKRSYGSIIMAYIRAGMPDRGEILIREMEAQEINAGSEVFKALLRAYSMAGDSEGAQRVFDAIQLSGIPPDAKICGLLINAYALAGQSQRARSAFENMRAVGIQPTDKCVALVLAAYERENNLNKALGFLISLEKDGYMVGKEASELLFAWFKRLGVVQEVEMILRQYASEENQQAPS